MATLSIQHPIDLRSDTVTKPSAPMREAMAGAEVGDDQYGEDPTVRRLEETVAALFGYQDAMFVPTGIMANHIGIRLQVAHGEELICDADAHIVAHENGGLAAHAGIQTRTLPSTRGLLDPAALAAMIRVGDRYTVGTRALEVENTHNRGGGAVYPIDTLREIRALADSFNLGLHLDGARIWNAHKASGVALRDYGAVAHTMSVCMSKGLGAPAGSLVLLPPGRSEEARALRRRLGGSMRQAGILAAGAQYALDNNLDRLSQDHENAARIATALRAAGASVREPETNIVLVDVDDAPNVAKECFGLGVRISPFGPKLLRIVTHLDVSAQDCDTAADVVSSVLMQSPERG
ncbi:threonine aldolase family protein [Catenulispora rubra]|uniref:threonine aldolase family protein n=1 Tax=Catenulispora rubra TaxID=280293 RepID=UPI0018926040|nr:GntG family PLP-dependent aldolase [Catenulispora rubra]